MQSQHKLTANQKLTLIHFLHEITKMTCFHAVSSDAPWCVFLWVLNQKWEKRDSRMACQWLVPLSEGSLSVNGEQLESKPEEKEHNDLTADPSLKRRLQHSLLTEQVEKAVVKCTFCLYLCIHFHYSLFGFILSWFISIQTFSHCCICITPSIYFSK